MNPLTAGVCIAVAGANVAAGQGRADFEQPPINYSSTTPKDALAGLQARITRGELALTGSEKQAVETLLAALNVPVASQLLVFSKTSLQRGRIRPERPRAIYFSDSVFVGWVPGGLVEVAAIDPVLGPVFYTVDLPKSPQERATVARENDCLRCHGGTFVRDVPGVFSRSVFASETGEPLLRHGTLVVDDETPFDQRWGGWYVTGYHGTESHRGNTFASELADQLVFVPSEKRPDTLQDFFDTDKYPAATSDVVALLVFEHQTTVQNSLTRANQLCRKMLTYQHSLQETFKEQKTDEPAYESVKSVFTSSVQDVLDRLLFRNEAPLPAGIRGSEAFRDAFTRRAARSAAGHSLKDLQLRNQLFAHRCSHLIYSDTFAALPETLLGRVLDRLGAILQGTDASDRYAYIPAEERQRIYDILVETHPAARARWTPVDVPGQRSSK